MLAHVDDDDVSKNGPNRIMARDRPPTRRDLKLVEEGKREDIKLAKVRGEKHRR
jgi:hypothetical protein